MVHLYRNGFKPRYFVWIDHGDSDGWDDMFYNSKPVDVYNIVAPHGQIRVEQVRVEHDRVHEMINDAFGVQGRMKPKQYFDEAPNEGARLFYDQLEESSCPLCEGSPHSTLSVAVRLMNIKSNWNVPNAAMDSMVDLLGELVNPEFKIPKNFSQAKCLVSKLGLTYDRIHCCVNDCMLFYKTDSELENCPRNPKSLIDVYLQPLIDELKQLWIEGVLIYDISTKQNFVMRASLMWTINDFPAYRMLSSWMTAGKLAWHQIWDRVSQLPKVTEASPSRLPGYEHLPIHLVQEARLGGPVQTRWMYPFERINKPNRNDEDYVYLGVEYWNTDKFKAISDQAKKARGSLKGGSLHTESAKTIGTIAREMEKELGRTPIEPEVFKNTHVRKKENEADLDVWLEERAERTSYVAKNLDSSVQLTPELSTQIWKEKVVGGTHKGRCYGLDSRNDVRRLQSGLEGIGSSRQAEALDYVQIVAMSDQIAKLTAALAESERRRVAEQESMSETIQ
ncbi:hypothetical protein MTR67_047962 [Solanum verrucosum]|uniref:DUF4218 domain-containing protein n=1 Tax=Solanum verrucosum TaxID=315347 RepID=A0AAF0UXK8_SOLVR|nr:hypothetical protein MTR67_047962 [Solanum verrucosum]